MRKSFLSIPESKANLKRFPSGPINRLFILFISVIKKFTFYGKNPFYSGKISLLSWVSGDSFALKLRKKVIKTMTYETSEFKITLKNFEVEELFNHFDVLGLQEIELDDGNFVYPENDEIKNVTLVEGI